MKKISIVSLFIIIIITISTVSFANTTGNVELSTSKAEYTNGEEMLVDVKISNLSSDEGIIALTAVLQYDRTNLQFKKIRGLGEWSNPSYNEDNGKLVVDRGSSTKSSESVFQITFKVISKNATKANISLTNVEVSGGAGEFSLSNASKSVSVKGSNSTSGGTTNKPSTNGSSTSTSGSSTSTSGSSTPTSGSSTSTSGSSTSTSGSSTSTSGSSTSTSGSSTSTSGSSSSSNKNKNVISYKANYRSDKTKSPKNIQNISTNNYSTKDLPKTGENTSVVALIVVGVMLSIIFYVRLKSDK